MNDADFQSALEQRAMPVLHLDGFRRVSPLHYGRILGDVFQLLLLHLDVHRGTFQAEYTSVLLVEPHTFASFDLGGPFPDGQLGKVYKASSLAELSHDLEVFLVDYLTVARPHLQVRGQLTGLLDAALRALGGSGSPHLWFTLAVGHSRLRDEKAARRYAQEALARYRTYCQPAADGSPNANLPWAKRGEQRAELLIEALYAGRTPHLLDGWRTGTLSALGLTALEE